MKKQKAPRDTNAKIFSVGQHSLTSAIAEHDFVVRFIPQQVHRCCHSFDHQRIVEARSKEVDYGRNAAHLTNNGIICVISNTKLQEMGRFRCLWNDLSEKGMHASVIVAYRSYQGQRDFNYFPSVIWRETSHNRSNPASLRRKKIFELSSREGRPNE